MGTIIEAVATAHGSSGLLSKGARRLADDAAKTALGAAGREAWQIDMLVNAGIYREDSLAEPALAAMIQEDIHANASAPVEEHHGTFSFDIANGGAGLVTGLELVDGFLRSGTIALGLVVASDAPPPTVEGFPYGSTGAALVLSREASERGFVDFAFETFDELDGLYESHLSWRPREHAVPLAPAGKNIVDFHIEPGLERAFVQSADEAARRFLARHELSVDDLDLVIPSQFPASFPGALGTQLGLEAARIAQSAVGGTHTAGPAFAYDAALRDGRVERAENVLFVAAGAGVNIGLALYRPRA